LRYVYFNFPQGAFLSFGIKALDSDGCQLFKVSLGLWSKIELRILRESFIDKGKLLMRVQFKNGFGLTLFLSSLPFYRNALIRVCDCDF
jgi:hypothetical protein